MALDLASIYGPVLQQWNDSLNIANNPTPINYSGPLQATGQLNTKGGMMYAPTQSSAAGLLYPEQINSMPQGLMSVLNNKLSMMQNTKPLALSQQGGMMPHNALFPYPKPFVDSFPQSPTYPTLRYTPNGG